MALNLRPVISNVTNWKKVDEGEANLAAVRAFFATHLCCTQRECAKALGLSDMAVNRHVRTIRAEWRGKSDAAAVLAHARQRAADERAEASRRVVP